MGGGEFDAAVRCRRAAARLQNSACRNRRCFTAQGSTAIRFPLQAPPRCIRLSLQRPAASNSPPASNRSRHAAASLGCFFLCMNTWIFCAASRAGESANASKTPFRRSTSFRTDQKPGTTLCQPQRVARIDSSPLVWTIRRATAKGGKGLCRVKKITPSAP